MLHPLNAKLIDPTCLFPFSSAQSLPKTSKLQLAKAVPLSRGQSTPTSPTDVINSKSEVDKSEGEGTPRKRLKTTSEQNQMLEEWFLKEPLPPRKLREEMVQKLDGTVSLRQLEVWFQNRRAKQKKAEARKSKSSGVGEVPSATPPSSPPLHSPLPSPPSTPGSSFNAGSLNGMAPNPSALIPSSPTSTPRTPSRKKAKINSQGTSVSCSPSIASSPSISSPFPIPSLVSISPLAFPSPMSPPSSRPIAKVNSKSLRSVSPVPQVPADLYKKE